MIDNAHMAVICSSVLLLDGGLDMPLCNVSVVRKGCGTMLPDIFTKYQQEIEDVARAVNEIYIVNAGRMNHGKSSLFNSLLDQEVFKADDVRTTVENQPTAWLVDETGGMSVTLVDTPGLDARAQDDEEAYTAYRKATAIIFVHTVKTGELHRDELEELNYIRKLFPTDEYFWNHFYLVFSFQEEVDEDAMRHIADESLRLIEEQCGGRGFPVFHVSNARYEKGCKNGKQGLIERSGIPELRIALQKALVGWREDLTALTEERIERLKKEAVEDLEQLRRKRQKEGQKRYQMQRKEFDRKKSLYDRIIKELLDVQALHDKAELEVTRLWDEYTALKERHRNEYY